MDILKYIVLIIILIFPSIICCQTSRHFPPGVREIEIPNVSGVRSKLLQNIAPIIERSIDNGLYPGAVILAAHHGKIIYRGVFGNRRIVPDIAPMTIDTIFDIASLTKVVVTTTAIMQLVERGKIDLDARVSSYWPAFSNNGKGNVTVRELMTHTSGFAAELTFPKQKISLDGRLEAFRGIEQQGLVNPPGAIFKYSDVNFITLGHLVEIITGESLDNYATKHIFDLVGMQHTFYLPPSRYKDDIAPTEIVKGELRWGVVHDATVYIMGGVAGMAGVFADANDLGLFAQTLLKGGRISKSDSSSKSSKFLLGPLTIVKMTSPQTPPGIIDVHGLGWDIDSRYSNRGILFPIYSFGHTGFTGTSMWIDPLTQTWLIILTSRTHPTPATINPLFHDRKNIANIVAGSITDVPLTKINNTGKGELARAFFAKTK